MMTFITVFMLLFSQTVYDPTVHARMQKMDDEHLAAVEAAALNIDMNLTVRAVAEQGMSLSSTRGGINNSLNIGYIVIGDGLNPDNSVRINTTMSWDIGATGPAAQIWLMMNNVTFPYSTVTDVGMGLIARNIFVNATQNATGALSTRWLANDIIINGLFFGQNVTPSAGTNRVALRPYILEGGGATGFTAPWIIISNRGGMQGGIHLYGQLSGYVEQIRLQYRGTAAAQSVIAQGLYIYGLMNTPIASARGAPGAWSERRGPLLLGGDFPVKTGSATDSGAPTGTLSGLRASIYTGSSGSDTRIAIDQPMSGSVRVRNFYFNGVDWGPLALDSATFYVNRVTIRNL